MQVAYPIDVVDALRIDLSALMDGPRFMCPPIPPDLQAGDVMIEPLGGASVSAGSDEYDVMVNCYGSTDADAQELANEVSGMLASLPFRDTSTFYSDASASKPKPDKDLRAGQLVRYSFRASVICPGIRIDF